MSRAMTTALTALFVVCSALVLIWALQRRLIYFPFGEVPAPEALGLTRVEPITFSTTDGLALNGWFFASPGRPAWYTVLVFNGNAGNRAYRARLALALRQHNMAVLLFDYRGYGGSPGTPTEAGLVADGRAARAYLVGRPDVDAARVIYLGESLGSAVAVALAVEHPPAALILRSPFTSLADLGQFHYPFLPVRWLLRDRFPSIDRIGQVLCPLLVIAGSRDRIVPAKQSRSLYDAAISPKVLRVVPDADHNDEELLAGPQLIEAIVQFLRQLG